MTQDELKATFVYEPERGMLRRIDRMARKPYPWRSGGFGNRYLVFSYGGRKNPRNIYLHQAVWLYHYGYTPEMIDHINGDPRDNRIENLRACTNSQNQFNSKPHNDNRSGIKGVTFCPNRKANPWHAKIGVNGRTLHLGRYHTQEEAAAAYAIAAAKHAGKFARVR